MVAEKLKIGDEIRVIAPSRSMSILSDDVLNSAKQKLEQEGFKITYSKNSMNSINDEYKCASIEDRVSDLSEAFKDENVKAILTVIGGFNVNQILDYIDYNVIKENPKILCGFSDITALSNAIYTKTGLVTYSGPHFSSFGMKLGIEYTLEYFKKMLMRNEVVNISSSNEWSNDSWYKNQDNRNFIKNDGMFCINEGIAEGRIIGGNLCTLNLLQGTQYMPNTQDVILFLEDDGMADKNFQKEFDRNLQSLIHMVNAKNIKGVVLGRAENNCDMDNRKWIDIIKLKKELNNIPVIGGADFGHTTPVFTFPIGGYAQINCNSNDIRITIKD